MPSGHRPLSEAESSARKRTVHVTSKIVLPQHVQDTLPSCAQSCLASYTTQDFTCPDNDLSCLCSQYSTDSFTLGEYAYICLQSSCRDPSPSEEDETYSICAAQPSAVPPTHSILTVPAPFPTATPSSSHQTNSATQTASTSPTLTLVTPTSQPPASGDAASSISSPDTTSPTAAAPASPTSTPASSNALTSVQAIGISIAAVGTVMMVIGAVWLFACRRRRKAAKQKEERHSYDFIDDAPPRFSPFGFGAADPKEMHGGFTFPTIEQTSEKRRTEWPSQYHEGIRYQFPAYVPYQDSEKGPARSPGYGASTPMARSDYSIRTTSQLLPDKPTTLSLVSLKRANDQLTSPATIFEEERMTAAPPAAVLPGLSASTMTSQRSHQPQFQQQYMRSQDRLRQPRLSLQIPKQAHRANTTSDMASFSVPQPPALRQPSPENRLSEQSLARISETSLLNYYAGTERSSPDLYASTPIEEQMQIRRPAPAAITITKPACPPRAVRASNASDHSNRTSFESTDPGEPTPPDEAEKRLTPVAESPIAAIRYPKIPRSSNQSVPRSPVYQDSARIAFQAQARRPLPSQQRRDGNSSPVTPDQQRGRGHTPTLSGSTLAAKRRGDSLAHDLERGLHIKQSNLSRDDSKKHHNFSKPAQARQQVRHESPLKGYGRVASPSSRGPDWPLKLHLGPEMQSPPSMKSPLWEPKLTPRREGDDLYLDLSLATPQHAHFRQRM